MDKIPDSEVGGKKRKASDVLDKVFNHGAALAGGRYLGKPELGTFEAQATLCKDLLELVGKDERESYYGPDHDTGRRVHYTNNGAIVRNDLRAEFRKAIKTYFGEDTL